ncbi:hypothetical protein PLICRDRAFT_50260 [Plicaturopsis crispa FD-325 SS-3]|nr:hypothetical protein PLICRDRAFT_50260 [Plicaturopsis crispa FD-325 SS-3]
MHSTRFSTLFLVLAVLFAFSAAASNVQHARSPAPSKRATSPVQARAPVPSKRYAARAPAPSKRHVARSPAPSKRYVTPVVARAPAPSKRLEGRSPAPSKRLEARAPAPSKRYAPSYPVNVVKRDAAEQNVALNGIPTTARAMCPAPMSACPVSGSLSATSARSADAFECVDFMADLKSCGGCSSLSSGHDCTTIKGAVGVSCVVGTCKVRSCSAGYTLSADQKTCIEA